MSQKPQKKSKLIVSIEENKEGLITINSKIDWERVNSFKDEALKNIAKTLTLKGFREGHVPINLVEKTAGAFSIAEECARIAIQHVYPDILLETKKDMIGNPSISITKIAPQHDLEFSIRLWKAPHVSLGDYKTIAQEVFAKSKPIKVTSKEVADALDSIRQQWARSEKWELLKKAASDAGRLNEEVQYPAYHEIEVTESDFPELTNEFVSKISHAKTVAEFKKTLSESILQEKQLKMDEQELAHVIDAIVKGSKFDIPSTLIEDERLRIEREFNEYLSKNNTSLEQYFQITNSSQEEMMKEWQKAAENRVKTQLVFIEISKSKKIVPSEQEVNEQAQDLMKREKGVDSDLAHSHVYMILTNREVIKHILSFKKNTSSKTESAPKEKKKSSVKKKEQPETKRSKKT